MKHVVVIDYGIGNIKSVQRGIEQVGAKVLLSSDCSDVKNADYLILPGVGAFKDGMSGLESAGLIDAIKEFVATGRPLMGICLGMQMLMDYSEEFGHHKGLGIISGSVIAIPRRKGNNEIRKIPHIGWNTIRIPEFGSDNRTSFLSVNDTKNYYYFVHSFMAVPEDNSQLLAQCECDDLMVTAAVGMDNIIGLQFHPEKSGDAGLTLLKRFING